MFSNLDASSSRSKPNVEQWTVMECRGEFEKAVAALRDRVKDGLVLSWDKVYILFLCL